MADVVAVVDIVPWGRKAKATWTTSFASLFLVVCCPIWAVTNWIALEKYGGSVGEAYGDMIKDGVVPFLFKHGPRPTQPAIYGYAAWLLFQAFLYGWLPGPISFGQMTPAGNLLRYTTNGLLAWAVTHALFLAASALGYVDPAIVANHWEGLLVSVNVYGAVLAALALVKAYVAPSHPGDRKFSGSIFFDFFVGIELNPRFGEYWDFKFFHNGRPGIVAWTLIDLSYMAYQYQVHGYVSNSIVIVTLFHCLYVVDFFYNEDWYLRTIDINHDHFGFMLAWGDTTFLPTVYTLQVQYLARYPVNLSYTRALAILALGIFGYAMFRSANNQKDRVRSAKGETTIWGSPAQCMKCTYRTEDGKTHQTLLLISGWWGFSRHANYLADLIQSFAMCATCGFSHFLPWTYFFVMCAILLQRADRVEGRCQRKYGSQWQEYCEKVPHKLIPGVY